MPELVGRTDGKRPIERRGSRWQNYIKHLKQTEKRMWTEFIWLRMGFSGKKVMKVRVP
jgi:hypothetical protein